MRVLFCASELTLEARRELRAFNARGMGARAFGLCGAVLRDYFAQIQCIAGSWKEIYGAQDDGEIADLLSQKRAHQLEALAIWKRAAPGVTS